MNGVVIGNTTFDNHEAGIALEDVEHAVVIGNKMVNNKWQLFLFKAQYTSEDNCFENRTPDQLTVHFYYPPEPRIKTLADYQREKRRDLRSREGGCGPLPEKVDVRKLHAESKAHAERARKLLAEGAGGR